MINKRIRGKTGAMIAQYNLITHGDRVLAGVSGGKDSMILLLALWANKKVSPINYEISTLCIDMWGDTDFSHVAKLCEELEIKCDILPTNIGKIVFELRKEKNPCALCSNMRRGALCEYASQNGFSKIALGHHQDDAIETILMSMFFSGQFSCFSPISYLSRKNVHIIRPLLYVTEKDIVSEIKRLKIEIPDDKCPQKFTSKRAYIKGLIRLIETEIPHFKANMFNTISSKWLKNDTLKISSETID